MFYLLFLEQGSPIHLLSSFFYLLFITEILFAILYFCFYLSSFFFYCPSSSIFPLLFSIIYLYLLYLNFWFLFSIYYIFYLLYILLVNSISSCFVFISFLFPYCIFCLSSSFLNLSKSYHVSFTF